MDFSIVYNNEKSNAASMSYLTHLLSNLCYADIMEYYVAI